MTLSDKPDLPGYIAPNGDEVLSIVYKRDGVTTAATGVHTGVWLAPLLSQVERDSRNKLLDELLEHSREYEVTDLEKLDHWNETPLEAVPVSVIKTLQSLEPGRE